MRPGYLARPTHLRLGAAGQAGGTMTACSLNGPEGRPIKTTRDPAKATCRNCRRWIRRQPSSAVLVSSIVRYRERHTIVPRAGRRGHGPVQVCEHDGIRVHPRRGGLYHDPGEVTAAEHGAEFSAV